jgi:hypothetical protein
MSYKKIIKIQKAALLTGAAAFCFVESYTQSDSSDYSFRSRFEFGLYTSWHPVRSATYPKGRLNLKLHDTPSPEFYFLAGFPIGKKGFGMELTASAGMLFVRESFTVDSVFVNGGWTDDRFRQNPIGTTFFGRFALQGFWQKKIKNLPLVAGVSVGVGTSLYMPSQFTSLGVDYTFSENPVDITIIHQVRINYPVSSPYLFIPLTFRFSYLFKNKQGIHVSFRAGFSHQNLMNARYVYTRGPHFYETATARVRDISLGLGVGYSFSSTQKKTWSKRRKR